VAAFILLDVDESQQLTGEEFAGLLRLIAKHEKVPELLDHEILQIFIRVDTDFDGHIDLLEFVKGVEEVFSFVEKSVVDKSRSKSPLKDQFALILQSHWFKVSIMVMLIVDAWAFTGYGLLVDTRLQIIIDYFTATVQIITMGELIARVYTQGFEIYWHRSRYRKEQIEVQFANRLDAIFTITGFACALITSVLFGFNTAGTATNARRFFLTFPLLRLLTLSKTSRHLLWCLVLIVPMFLNLLIVLALVYLVFATYGLYMFAGKFDVVIYAGVSPPGNFDTLRNSVFVLFQLMVGEAWHEVMYAAIKTNGWNAAYYFIAFTIIVSLLFTNLFVGVILSVYQLAAPLKQPTYKDLMSRRQEDLAKKAADLVELDDDSDTDSDDSYSARRPRRSLMASPARSPSQSPPPAEMKHGGR
jgi:hypothetical protein